jgi:hypothetical protein
MGCWGFVCLSGGGKEENIGDVMNGLGSRPRGHRSNLEAGVR